MFSKNKINEPAPSTAETAKPAAPATPAAPAPSESKASTAPKPKPPASVLSSDLHITGNLKTSGDIQVEGTVEGDIIHKTIAIESGAHFEGSVQRQDDPLNPGRSGKSGANPAAEVKQ